MARFNKHAFPPTLQASKNMPQPPTWRRVQTGVWENEDIAAAQPYQNCNSTNGTQAQTPRNAFQADAFAQILLDRKFDTNPTNPGQERVSYAEWSQKVTAPVFDPDVARAAAASISDLLSGTVWHASLTVLVDVLASGSAQRLQEAVLANRLMLLSNLPADAPVPETLWG